MSALFGVATYRAYVYLDVVDSFVADPQFAFQSKAMFNLFRTEVRSDQPLDFCPFYKEMRLPLKQLRLRSSRNDCACFGRQPR